jgi:hypothetical protein
MPGHAKLIQQKTCRHGVMAFLRADQYIGKALEPKSGSWISH